MTNNNSQKGIAMTTVIAIIALVVVIAVVGYSATKKQPQTTSTTQTPTGEKTLADGTMVKPDGTMVKPDGTMVKTDGTMIKPDGTMVKADDKAMMAAEEGFELKGGKMLMVNEKTKVTSPMEKDVTLKDGTKVMISGKIVKKDATTVMLKEGESIWMDGTITKAGEMMKKEPQTMMKAGSYEAYSPEKIAMASSTHNVVLFFHASWCPTCRALDADIKSHLNDIPANLTVLDVDYDTSASLKQKYGVTVQHTLVEVDAKGNLIKKWLGSPTLAVLVSEIK